MNSWLAPERCADRPFPRRWPSGGPPATPVLRWTVSLTSTPHSLACTAPAAGTGLPRRPGIPAAGAPVRPGRGPGRGQVLVVAMGFTIGPDREISFCAVVEPSNRLVVVRYGPTLLLVTKVRPVSVSGGSTRPPDSLKR